MRILSQSAACALIALANGATFAVPNSSGASATASANASANGSANASASANANASSEASANASASSNASATGNASASANSSASSLGYYQPYRAMINRTPLMRPELKPEILIQPELTIRPCSKKYNDLRIFEQSGYSVDLPKCDADGYYSMIQCDKNYCWCSDRDGKEIGSRQSKFNVRSRLVCERKSVPTTVTCSSCPTQPSGGFTGGSNGGWIQSGGSNGGWIQTGGWIGTGYQPGLTYPSGGTTQIIRHWNQPTYYPTTTNWGISNANAGANAGTSSGPYFPINSNSASANAEAGATTGGGSSWATAKSSAEVVPSNGIFEMLGKK